MESFFRVALYQLDMKLDQPEARADGVEQQMERPWVVHAESFWQNQSCHRSEFQFG
jgi:hypothetical protein